MRNIRCWQCKQVQSSSNLTQKQAIKNCECKSDASAWLPLLPCWIGETPSASFVRSSCSAVRDWPEGGKKLLSWVLCIQLWVTFESPQPWKTRPEEFRRVASLQRRRAALKMPALERLPDQPFFTHQQTKISPARTVTSCPALCWRNFFTEASKLRKVGKKLLICSLISKIHWFVYFCDVFSVTVTVPLLPTLLLWKTAAWTEDNDLPDGTLCMFSVFCLFFYLVLGSLTLLNIKMRAAWQCEISWSVCAACLSPSWWASSDSRITLKSCHLVISVRGGGAK